VEYSKVKSVSKQVQVRGEDLDNIVLDTMRTISMVVGGTLGPGGCPVLIERQEFNLPPFITKDGVTVYKSLGFDSAIAHCVMEVTRDSAVRTANEAGDGTTTATILTEAIVRLLKQYCKENRQVSPQKVVRHLERTFRDHVEPAVTQLSRTVQIEKDAKLLHSVAQVSANGDVDLADAVMRCFDVTGDQGNVTIVEAAGPSKYEVEQVKGFPIAIGYEESCSKYFPQFINDPGTQRCVMENPAFLLYHGRVNELQSLLPIMSAVSDAFEHPKNYGLEKPFTYNVVLVATGFSDMVLASLAGNFGQKHSINVFPLQIPNNSPQSNAQFEFLQDLAAVTGAKICDVLKSPLVSTTLDDLGVGCTSFECSRYRSTVVGYSDETVLQMRAEEVEQMLRSPESELDKKLLQERLAKLSGGIAKLRIMGSSNGELKEKRDRAEDAVCAVRGALKAGVLPGGGWTLLKLCNVIPRNDINDKILRPAFVTPFNLLLENSGVVLGTQESESIVGPILTGIRDDKTIVYDFLERAHVNPYDGGILDSTPAVLEAIRNAISSASQIGTMGGVVVFKRDSELERTEAKATADWLRQANENQANERA
jgi:chaperonin GroEL